MLNRLTKMPKQNKFARRPIFLNTTVSAPQSISSRTPSPSLQIFIWSYSSAKTDTRILPQIYAETDAMGAADQRRNSNPKFPSKVSCGAASHTSGFFQPVIKPLNHNRKHLHRKIKALKNRRKPDTYTSLWLKALQI